MAFISTQGLLFIHAADLHRRSCTEDVDWSPACSRDWGISGGCRILVTKYLNRWVWCLFSNYRKSIGYNETTITPRSRQCHLPPVHQIASDLNPWLRSYRQICNSQRMGRITPAVTCTLGWPVLHLMSRIYPPWTESGAFGTSTCWFRISSRIEIILNSWHRTRRLKMFLFGFCCIYCMLQMLQIYWHLHYLTPSTKIRVSRPVLVPRLATRVLQWSPERQN